MAQKYVKIYMYLKHYYIHSLGFKRAVIVTQVLNAVYELRFRIPQESKHKYIYTNMFTEF